MKVKSEKSKEMFFSILLLILLIILIAIMFYDLIPLFTQVMENIEHEENMTSYIASYGIKGVPILILLQTLQVITAFFPAAAVQLLAGLCYGIWFGMLICLVGYLCGNALVFCIVRQLDNTFYPLFKQKDNKKKKTILDLSILKKSKRPEVIAFMLFLIPGIPNGFLPYIFARTNISLKKYLMSITAASIPSILICTVAGSRVAKGDTLTAILIFLVFFIIISIVFFFRDKILAYIEKNNS